MVLTALPAIGTVLWRSQCGATVRWSIGLRAFRASATDDVTYTAGGVTVQKRLQPGETVWFAWSRETVRVLRVRQQTEPGALGAVVRVDFGRPPAARAVAPHCYSYMPPALRVDVFPRT